MASDVSAAPSFASTQRLQVSTTSLSATSQPFAALLDATAPIAPMPPPATNAPTIPPSPQQPPPAPANAPAGTANSEPNAASGSAGTTAWSNASSNAGSNSGSNTPSVTATPAPTSPDNRGTSGANGGVTVALIVTDGLRTAPQDTGGALPDASGNGKAQAGGPKKESQTPNTNPDPSAGPDIVGGTIPIPQANRGKPAAAAVPSVPSNGIGPGHTGSPPGAAPPGSNNGAELPPAADAAPIVVAPSSDTQAPQQTTTTTPSNSHGNKAGDSDSPTDTTVAAPPVNPPQAVAAVIVANVTVATAPAAPPAGASGAPAAIGESAKGRGRDGPPVDAGQDGPQAQNAPSGTNAPQQPTAGTEGGAANAASASSAEAANAGSPPQVAPAQISNDTAAAPPSEDIAANGIGHSNAPGGGLSTPVSSAAGASGGQGGGGVGHATADGLPNFGFAVATPAAPSASGGASTTAATAPVPIAGLAVAIAARAQDGSNQFEIRLDPPELGRIDVRLDVDRDGQVTTHVAADRADTLALLQSQQPQLERALEQAGLKTADNGLQFTLRDQSFAGQNNGGGGSQPKVAQLVIPDSSLAPVDATQIYARSGLGGGLDIRV